ncbi:MAG: 3-methyl-2-oxobutanoate dehydrogenase subunit VorB [Planctomycetes bacterium]|nr:3-methyl-2-oxobutanoate dehydrogenase subunit VorB [Planctomycetota bacterium]
MPSRVLMTGNEAAAEAAIRAGCRFYYGYPITPQNEICAYMAAHLPEVGGTFLQAESELAAISMVHGSAGAGARAMTSSSSPGISLKQEGISYLAGSELPAVIINVQRGGPGLGDISASQSDYFQATRGGGHGDYRTLVLAPYSAQEMADLMFEAFDLADKYRTPVLVLADAQLGQMMEPVEFRDDLKPKTVPKPWALTGAEGRARNIVMSFYPIKGELEAFNRRLQEKYTRIKAKEARCEEFQTKDAQIILVAYGTSARVCKEAVKKARERGVGVGLIRPITLWPFPERAIRKAAEKARAILTVEMSLGQMVEDVRLAVEGCCPVHLHGRPGGGVPATADILRELKKLNRTSGRVERRRAPALNS